MIAEKKQEQQRTGESALAQRHIGKQPLTAPSVNWPGQDSQSNQQRKTRAVFLWKVTQGGLNQNMIEAQPSSRIKFTNAGTSQTVDPFVAIAAMIHCPELIEPHLDRLTLADFPPLLRFVARQAAAEIRMFGMPDRWRIMRLAERSHFSRPAVQVTFATIDRMGESILASRIMGAA